MHPVPGCDFAPCYPIGNAFGPGLVLAGGGTLICEIAEPCGVIEDAVLLTSLLLTGAATLHHVFLSSNIIKDVARRFCVNEYDLRCAVEDEKRRSGRGGKDNLGIDDIEDIARTLPKVPGCNPSE